MEVINKNRNYIAGTVGIAAFAIGIYFITKKLRALTEKEKITATSQVKLKYNGPFLSTESLVEIAKLIGKFEAESYSNLCREGQSLRLKYKDNLALYVKTSEDYVLKMKTAATAAQDELFSRLGISRQVWRQSLNYSSSQGKPIDTELLAQEARSNQAGPRKKLTFEQLKKVVIRAQELLEAEMLKFSNLKELVKKREILINILYNRVADVIFEESDLDSIDWYWAMTKHDAELKSKCPELYQRYVATWNYFNDRA